MRKLFTFGSSFAFVALLSSGSFAAPPVAPPAPQVRAPAVHAQPKAVLAHQAPPAARPKAYVYGYRVQDGTNDVHLNETVVMGADYGTKFDVTVQMPSKSVAMPTREGTPGVARPAPGSADARAAKQEADKAIAGSVGNAVQERSMSTTTSRAMTPKGYTVDTKTANARKDIIPINSPVTLHGRDLQNRPLPPAHATAEVGEIKRIGGKESEAPQARYSPWANMSNVFSTAAYVRDGKTFTKVLGLAAFPRNATVKVTNTRLRASGADGATVEFGALNASGSGSVEVPALKGDLIEVEVSYPDTPGQLYPSTTKHYYTVPAKAAPQSTTPMKTKDGLPFLRVDEAVPLPEHR